MVESTSAAKIVVAESGNKRKTIGDEDVEQCVKDMTGWFQSKAADYYKNNLENTKGATSDEIKNVLLEFNATGIQLGIALLKYNGKLQYQDTFIGLTVAEISELGGKHNLKDKQIVPFAQDIDGTLQCIHVQTDGKESVIAWDCDSSEIQEDLKISYAEYIEQIRN